MALSDILNVVSCTASDILDGGQQGCDFDFDNLKHARFWKRGATVPATADYNKAYLRAAQQSGDIVAILNDMYDFTWNTGEDVREQAESTGLSSTTRKGIYGVTLKYRKGLYNQKILNSLDGGNFDLQLIDGDGNELWTETSTGGAKGFSTSMISVDPIMFKNGTTSQKTGVTIEFSNSSQFNKSIAWNKQDQLNYLPEEVDGANNVSVSIPTAPSNGDTTIVVRTVLGRGGEFVSNLPEANFLVKVAGATVATAGIAPDATAKTYTLTVPALATGQAVEASLYDSTANSVVVIINPGADDVLYKSNTATSVVA